VGAATALLLLTAAVVAEPVAAQPTDTSRLSRFHWENDIGDGDRFYTNGLRYSTTADAGPTWRRRAARHWFWRLPLGLSGAPFCEGSDGDGSEDGCRRLRVGHAFGQNFYTPTDITLADPPLGDRPYGAVLYVGRTLQAAGRDAVQSVEYSVGVVGPLALGENVQQGWHQLIGDPDWPSGWDTQMPFEPALSVAYRGQWRLLELRTPRPWRLGAVTPWSPAREPAASAPPPRVLDIRPRWGVTAGTVFREVTAGAAVRVGWNISSDLVDRIEPVRFTLSTADTAAARQAGAAAAEPGGGRRFGRCVRRLGWRVVAPRETYVQYGRDWIGRQHSVFLDGPQLFFEPQRTVERVPWVRDEELGGVVRVGCGYALALRRVARSGEFRGAATQRFWSFSVSRDRRF
jgi:hypothetical protein